MSVQTVNGSPVNPDGQEQIGLCLTVSHLAFNPQVPWTQGSTHFERIQALFMGHSELTTHSGLQFGGVPINSGRHVQTAWSLTTRH